VFEIKSRYSAGHHAVEYHAPMTDEVHMWSFDSIWTSNYNSQMDNLVPRGKRPDLNQQWIPHWKNIFDANKTTQFIIHTPGEVVLPDIGTNVTHISH